MVGLVKEKEKDYRDVYLRSNMFKQNFVSETMMNYKDQVRKLNKNKKKEKSKLKKDPETEKGVQIRLK